jgi:hypothetical protein
MRYEEVDVAKDKNNGGYIYQAVHGDARNELDAESRAGATVAHRAHAPQSFFEEHGR